MLYTRSFTSVYKGGCISLKQYYSATLASDTIAEGSLPMFHRLGQIFYKALSKELLEVIGKLHLFGKDLRISQKYPGSHPNRK